MASNPSRKRALKTIVVVLVVLNIFKLLYPVLVQVCVLVTGCYEQGAQRVSAWMDEHREAARQRRIDSQTSLLPHVDKVVVYSIGDSDDDLKDGFFIRRRGEYAPVLNEKSVEGNAAEEIAALWRSRWFEQVGAMCHDPPYGLRFYSKGRTICEASVCWMCRNCYLGQDVTGFGDENEALLDHLQTIVALPTNTQVFIAIERADRALHYNDLETAQTHIRHALKLASNSTAALLRQGELFARKNDALAAANVYKQIITLYPDIAAGYWAHGELLARQGEYAQAIVDIEQAIANADDYFRPPGPFDRSPAEYLGILYLANGDIDYGLDQLRKARGPLSDTWFWHNINCFVHGKQMSIPANSCLTTDKHIYCDALCQLQSRVDSVLGDGIISPDGRYRLRASINAEDLAGFVMEVRDVEGLVLQEHVTPVSPQSPWLIDWGQNNSVWLATAEKLVQWVETAPGQWSVVEYHDPNELPASFVPFYNSTFARVEFVQP